MVKVDEPGDADIYQEKDMQLMSANNSNIAGKIVQRI
jgi:hypothetical protein